VKEPSKGTDWIPQPVYEADGSGAITYTNPSGFQVTGYTPRDLERGVSILELLAPQQRDVAASRIGRILAGEQLPPYEYTIRRRDGSEFPALIYSNPFTTAEGKPGLRGIMIDISELRETEKNLQRNQALLMAVSEHALDSIFCKNLEYRYTFVSRAMAELVGRPAGEIVGRTPVEVFGEAMGVIISEVDAACARGETVSAVRTLEIQGATRTFHTIQTPILSADGAVSGICGIVRDVTESQRREALLRHSEARFRSLFNNASVGMALVDPQGRVVEANEADCRFLGYGRGELIGMRASRFIHPDDIAIDRDLYQELLRGERDSYSVDKRYLRKDGTVVWGRLSVSLIPEDEWDQRYTVVVCEDIDERRRMEEQLRHYEKTQAIGQMAGGIAHDFNNQLGGILCFADLLRRGVADRPRLEAYAGKIVESVRHSATLTSQLLAFARRERLRMEVVDVNRLISETVAILERTLDKAIAIDRRLEAKSPCIRGSFSHLQNVLFNLAFNARDAMTRGGTIRFATRDSAWSEEKRRCPDPDLAPGQYLVLEISDTGTGIPPRDLGRIFEPFFTTKEKNKGTGLGLSAAYGTVKSHGGSIFASSTMGEGSVFTILLPSVPGPDRKGSVPPAETREEGGERVLLVDDEDIVREGLAESLERSGYRVTSCRSGEEALAAFERGPGEFDVTVMDMVLPGIGGREVWERIREVRPDLKCVFISGWSGGDRWPEGELVTKPFATADLIRAIKRTLGEPPLSPPDP